MNAGDLAARLALLSLAASKNWEVIKCDWAASDEACGITCDQEHPAAIANGHLRSSVVRDCSYDECHHPASVVDMELAVLLRNHVDLIIDALTLASGKVAKP